MKYLLRIRYVGTDFCGFQVQKNGRTVQGELQAAAERLFGCPCLITGCSRTDSGVHAEEFYLTLEPASPQAAAIPPAAIPAAMLQYLPYDLAITYAEEPPSDFHPRYDALGKEYRYLMRFGYPPDPFLVHRVWQMPYRLSEEGFGRMRRAAADLVGTHDFTSFMCTESDIEDRVRTISALDLTRDGPLVTLSVTGNGFLYNMVRIITGTLFEIGVGRREVDSIPATIAACDRTAAGMTAPPDGLYLHRVFYSKKFGNTEK